MNWIAGVVYSELPGFFHERKAAQEELTWCVEHPDKAPHAGWLREVYYHLGKLAVAQGEQAKAQDYLKQSGYEDFNSPITLITPFSENLASGHTFAPKRIAEIVPGRVYVLTGFEFTEYYFVVSDDGRELIGIDAGTRPDSAKAAYEALRAYAPNLPELTTIFITHSHWDHIGGHVLFSRPESRICISMPGATIRKRLPTTSADLGFSLNPSSASASTRTTYVPSSRTSRSTAGPS